MNRKRALWLLIIVIIIVGPLSLWMYLRSIYPSGEVNYLNYMLLKKGQTIEDVESIIGPFNDTRKTDINTGKAVLRPGKNTGVMKCIWFDKDGPFGREKIYITFVGDRATGFEYFYPMP